MTSPSDEPVIERIETKPGRNAEGFGVQTKKLTPVQDWAIAWAYESKRPMPWICRFFKVSPNAVYRSLKRTNTPTRKTLQAERLKALQEK